MTILEAASCEAPIMLRDLDLYKVILDGNYRATSDVSEMREAILEYKNDPEALKDLKEKAREISKEYSEEHLLEIWLKFYREQAALGKKWGDLCELVYLQIPISLRFPGSRLVYGPWKLSLKSRGMQFLSLQRLIKTWTDTRIGKLFAFRGVPFFAFKDRRFAYRGFTKALEIAKQYQLDIIIPRQNFSLGLLGIWIARELKIPVIHTYHTQYEDYVHYIAKGMLIRRVW